MVRLQVRAGLIFALSISYFNPNMVRLQVLLHRNSNCITSISIPIWFDYKTRLPQVIYVIFDFNPNMVRLQEYKQNK